MVTRRGSERRLLVSSPAHRNIALVRLDFGTEKNLYTQMLATFPSANRRPTSVNESKNLRYILEMNAGCRESRATYSVSVQKGGPRSRRGRPCISSDLPSNIKTNDRSLSLL